MNISELMTTDVCSCFASDSLDRAANIMWENDCGAVPVIDTDNRVVGMLTDRDICMAAYTQGLPLPKIKVASAMSKHVFGVTEWDPIESVEALMRQARVRRVPVLDGRGRIRGILSLNDLVRYASESGGAVTDDVMEGVTQTMAAISKRRPPQRRASEMRR
jgi:CBS-domain-containing membrane protein